MGDPMEVHLDHFRLAYSISTVFVGLLVAACVNRAPEGTFGAAVAEVGVLDLLKVFLYVLAHIKSLTCFLGKFADFTIGMAGSCCHWPSFLQRFILGKAWTSDYGDPHDPHDFDFIHPISPLHNIPTDRILPPTILHTADRKHTSFQVFHQSLMSHHSQMMIV